MSRKSPKTQKAGKYPRIPTTRKPLNQVFHLESRSLTKVLYRVIPFYLVPYSSVRCSIIKVREGVSRVNLPERNRAVLL